MTDAYVETTVLTDILLKPNSLKQKRAKAAFARYQSTLLPVYSIKEWKAGPLRSFAYLHDKLAVTQSFADTIQALSALSNAHYRKSTAIEALAAATTLSKRAKVPAGLGTTDAEAADSYRLALASLIVRSWKKRRKITTRVVDDLPCYFEAAPRIGKDGLLDLDPTQCDGNQLCCLGPQLRPQQKMLEALRNAIPEKSGRSEDQRRRRALKQLIKHPNEKIDRNTCRDLGDAIFAFFCPPNAVVLTTNLKDHEPLARSIGKKAEKP